jgi:hypothetical protein
VSDLRRSAWIFGVLQFTWNGSIATAVDGNVTGAGPSRRRDLSQFSDWYLPDNYTENQLNIYFTGWVQNSPNGYTAGLTLDPRSAINLIPPLAPCVIINDGGGSSGQGFDIPIAAIRDDWATLVHEIGHYLGPFEGLCFGPLPVQRCYDSEEHTIEGSENIMALCEDCVRRRVLPYWPVEQVGTSEFDQVSTSVRQGGWNQPN